MVDQGRSICITQAIRGRSGPGWAWDSGVLPDYDVWLPTEGRGVLLWQDQSWPAGRGDCFILRKGEAYSARQEAGSTLRTVGIHFDYTTADGEVVISSQDALPVFHRRLTNPDFVIGLADRAVDAWRRDNPARRDLHALTIWGKAALQEIAGQDDAARDTGVPHAQRVAIERICTQIGNAPEDVYSVEHMARRLQCSRWQFRRIFKRCMGMTPQEYVVQARINAAKTLLEMSLMNVKQIALQLNYTDASYFNKQFRAHTGLTPNAYRRKMRR